MAKQKTTSKISQEEQIVGISVISSIVSKLTSDPAHTALEILAGLKQTLYFYRMIPAKWKMKASWLFDKLWAKDEVIISTNPEQPDKLYNINLEDKKLNNLYLTLPQVDQAIMLQGKSMRNLIDKGLHSESDEIKLEIEARYGVRGLNIINMLTTGDIQHLLDEIENTPKKSNHEEKFNEWALYYDKIAILVKPLDLKKPNKIIKDVINLAKNTSKDYILVNMSGKMEECTSLLNLLSGLKDNKKLIYRNFSHDISDSGFCKSLRMKINFK